MRIISQDEKKSHLSQNCPELDSSTEPTPNHQATWQILVEMANEEASRATPEAIADVLWKLSETEFHVERVLIDALLRNSREQVGSFPPVKIVQLISALSRLKHCPDPALAAAFGRGVAQGATTIAGHDAAFALWSFAKLRADPGPDAVEPLAERAAATAATSELAPRVIQGALWGLARLSGLGRRAPEAACQRLLAAAASAADGPNMLSQDAARVLWAARVLGLDGGPALSATTALRRRVAASAAAAENAAGALASGGGGAGGGGVGCATSAGCLKGCATRAGCPWGRWS